MVHAVAVPPAVVTVTSAGPSAPGGVTALMLVALLTTMFGTLAPPIVTMLPDMKLVPVISTIVPPAVDPLGGVIPVTVGAWVPAAVMVNVWAFDVPPPGAGV